MGANPLAGCLALILVIMGVALGHSAGYALWQITLAGVVLSGIAAWYLSRLGDSLAEVHDKPLRRLHLLKEDPDFETRELYRQLVSPDAATRDCGILELRRSDLVPRKKVELLRAILTRPPGSLTLEGEIALVRALGQQGREAAPVLVGLVGAPQHEVDLALIEALRQLGPEVTPAVIDGLAAEGLDLGTIWVERRNTLFLELLANWWPEVRTLVEQAQAHRNPQIREWVGRFLAAGGTGPFPPSAEDADVDERDGGPASR